MNRKSLVLGLALSCVIVFGSGKAYAGKITTGRPPPPGWSRAWRAARAAPSALVVRCTSLKAQRARYLRVDPQTGDVSTFASGLPKSIIGIGGAMDVAFIGRTAYVLVTLVGDDVGGSDVVGIYRVDGPDSFTVIADIGAFSTKNPSNTVSRPDRSPVRTGDLPWRVPGHRWAPQPRAAGHARRRGHRDDCVRQHRPDRAGSVGQHGVHGRGRSRPPPARGRQGRVVRAEVIHRHGGGLRRQAPRRRGVWPRSQALRPLAGHLRGRR